MRASVIDDTTTRIITLEVSGVPDVNATKSWQHNARWLRPDRVIIRIVDAEVRELQVSGGLILNSGLPSTKICDRMSWQAESSWGLGEKLSDAPKWVQTLWDEAPAGVTSWGEPTEPELEPGKIQPVQVWEHPTGALILDVD